MSDGINPLWACYARTVGVSVDDAKAYEYINWMDARRGEWLAENGRRNNASDVLTKPDRDAWHAWILERYGA
jgi:hypothetical protein